MRFLRVVLGLLVFAFPIQALFAGPAAAEIDARDCDVVNGFDGLGPADLSGIACIPIEQGKAYRCLVVNDETQSAQLARVEDGKIEAGGEIRLIGESPDPETVGARPRSVPCPKITNDFEELDGEGVAYATPTRRLPLYW